MFFIAAAFFSFLLWASPVWGINAMAIAASKKVITFFFITHRFVPYRKRPGVINCLLKLGYITLLTRSPIRIEKEKLIRVPIKIYSASLRASFPLISLNRRIDFVAIKKPMPSKWPLTTKVNTRMRSKMPIHLPASLRLTDERTLFSLSSASMRHRWVAVAINNDNGNVTSKYPAAIAQIFWLCNTSTQFLGSQPG